MLAALAPYGRDAQHSQTLGDACFGRALQLALPEDAFDRQPLVGAAGRYLLTADVRIDNRSEVATKVGIETSILATMSDSDLLVAAWERWQLDCFDHLLGDVAVAVWDSHEQRLTLARSPNSLKPLFYHQGRDFVAFASMPHGLLALPEIPKRLDLFKAAAIVAGVPDGGTQTIFEGITLVRHAEAVVFTGGTTTVIALWDLAAIGESSLSVADAGEALKAEFDRAVTAQLRRRSEVVACQLSSGRDSSAVAATAALAMRGTRGQLVTLTGAPHIGFAGPVNAGRLADESGLAAITSERYPEITHVTCRSRRSSLRSSLRHRSTFHHRPITNPTAMPWTDEIDAEAARRGASVMLNGSTGNYSISSSGTGHLVDVLHRQGVGRWWQVARRIGGSSWASWRSIGSVTLGPLLPEPLYEQLLRTTARRSFDADDMALLRQPYRAWTERQLGAEYGDSRPPSSFAQRRRALLLARDNAEKMSPAIYGLDLRDPTSDRRLVELCLSLAPDRLASRTWEPSPVYAHAFRDRIPDSVIYNRTRGQQGADWFELFTSHDVAEAVAAYRENAMVRELLDFAEIDRMIADWPEQGCSDWNRLARYRNLLLPALAVADFIDLHFPN